MQIFLDNETDYNPGFDLEELTKEVSKYILSEEKCPFQCEISLLVTDDEGIREVNRDFRGIDKETDVLSFPMFEKGEIKELGNIEYPEPLGDIVISIDRVKEQAKEYGHSFERELAYMVVHGFYHLMGEDHIEEADRVKMREKEEFVLGKLSILRI